MKKIISFTAALFTAVSVFAYNPPAGGQGLFTLSSPVMLASASSCAGGGIFMPGADSISFNPALTSMEQRIQLDAGFSALISTNDNDDSFHSAFQTGILIPTKAFVASAVFSGVFCQTQDMFMGDSINTRAGLSKEITDKLSVGMNLNGGIFWGEGTDWALGADLGVLYRREELKFLKDFRVGVSLLNLGKYYKPEIPGIDDENECTPFPSVLTLRTGVASLFCNTEQFKCGFSFDISAPSFQDVVFDFGIQLAVKDVFYFNIAESIDVMEEAKGHSNLLPSISFGLKFNLNAKNNEYLKSRSWDSNEMLATLGWQQRYSTIQDVSADVRLYLGQQDKNPPVIQLWAGEDD